MTTNSFGARGRLAVGGTTYEIFRLDRVDGTRRLPYSLKVLLENLLRCEDGSLVTAEQVSALAAWDPAAEGGTEIGFTPARVLLQDFTGVPCVVDLVAMRDAMAALGGDPRKITPLIPAELVIDHSVIAEMFERIHRSNLIGMGVLPLQFKPGESIQSLGLSGEERYSITGLEGTDGLPRQVTVHVEQDGHRQQFAATVRIDTPRRGGLLPSRRDPALCPASARGELTTLEGVT